MPDNRPNGGPLLALQSAAPLGARIAGILGIAAEGVPLTAAIFTAGLLLAVLGVGWPGAIVIGASVMVGAFFRDPERVPNCSAQIIVSGADGRVTDISDERLPGEPLDQLYRKVSIFMSPLDVHVNRAPVSGEIAAVVHTPGRFRAAFRDLASEHNERNLIVLTDAAGRRHAMMQVAGYFARRIVCRLRPCESVACGERVGIIMFGSRVDHFVPPGYRVTIEVGARVRAGESIIARLADEA